MTVVLPAVHVIPSHVFSQGSPLTHREAAFQEEPCVALNSLIKESLSPKGTLQVMQQRRAAKQSAARRMERSKWPVVLDGRAFFQLFLEHF